MNQPHPADLLIPFYAAGTLGPEQAAEVERRLEHSPEARELFDLARAAVARGEDIEQQPVHPLLLTEYAEDPGALDPATRRHVETLLARSPLSRQALGCLEQTLAAERGDASEAAVSASAPTRWPARLWEILRGSVLHPLPALAYLLLACALLPIWRQRDAPPLALPEVIVVAGDQARRGAANASGPALVVEGKGQVWLELHTGLLAEDLAGDGGWTLTLERDDEVISSLAIDRSRFELDPRGARMKVLLDLDALQPNRTYTLVLRVRRPGDLLDGHALFRQLLERR